MHRVLMCLLAGPFLTGAAGGEEPPTLKESWKPLLEESSCGADFAVVWDFIERAPVGDDTRRLQGAISAVLSQNMFECPTMQVFASAVIDDGPFNDGLRADGLDVPTNPDRARAVYRRLAFYTNRADSFDLLSDTAEYIPGLERALESAQAWYDSLESMTADALLAEARRHQAQDDDLSKYLERMAALKGSPEAAVLVARRALADPDFGFDLLLVAYLLRAIEAGAADLEPAADRLLRRMYDHEPTRQDARDSLASEEIALDDKLLWR